MSDDPFATAAAYLPDPRGVVERFLWWRWRNLPYREQITRMGRWRGQTCFVWCPGCGCDLAGHPDTEVQDDELVHYACGVCGASSTWNFDIAPAPILVSTNA